MPREVVVNFETFMEICKYSSNFASFKIPREKWVECMGYLFCDVCKPEDKQYRVVEAVGMTSGSEMRVEMPPEELAKIESMLDDRPGKFLGGWWHTHPGLSLFYSDTDVQNQTFYQQHNEDGLGIVFDLNTIADNFIGFKVFRNDSKDSKTYHEVPYLLEGFNEPKLKIAFSFLGGIPDRMIHNICINYGWKNGEIVDVADIEVPDTNDPLNLADDFFNKAKNKLAEKNYSETITNMRIAAELYIKSQELEMAIECLLDVARYSIIINQTHIANAMCDEIVEIVENHELEAPEFFIGKMHYIQGLARGREKNLAKAAMEMLESQKHLDEEEDYEEFYDASFQRGTYLELMGLKKEALENYMKALKSINMILSDIDNAEEYEDRNWQVLAKTLNSKITELKGEKKDQGLARIT